MPQSITRAMILAAGYGTRLKPLTDTRPKALISYKGKPMIENVIIKIKKAGINEITINTHYLAEKIKEYLDNNKFGGLKVNLTYEKEILGTGGGIKNAAGYLKGSANFLVHNVDVESDIDLAELTEFHLKNSPLATLAVKKRDTTRPLLIDEDNNLIGRIREGKQQLLKEVSGPISQISFCGV
ncbi:MAG TPA: nucleotidyltransferase family protein, partial [Ignavibacteria bacterium]